MTPTPRAPATTATTRSPSFSGPSADGVTAEPLDFRDAGERVVVVLQTHTPPKWGDQPEPHGEVVTVRDGKVIEMVVYPTVDEALRAAGLNARA